MALQPILMPILSLFRSAGITQARSAIFGLNKDFNHFATSVGKSAAAFAAFQGLAGARQFTVDAVEATQRFERNLLGLQQVFESATPGLRSFVREVENYGLSQAQAAQAAVFIGSVLKQYGFSVDEASMQTQRLTTLAQDLATTYGYDVQEALLAITALFRGEFDPIEKFGVAMKQSEINARMAADGFGNLEGEAFNLASAQTRLTMLFERAGDSVGAYTRAADTLFAAQQQLNAVISNMQVAFGAPLQRPIAQVINQFTELAQKYGPDVQAIGVSIGEAISGMAPLFKALSETFFLLIAPLNTVVRGIGALATGLSAVLTPVLNLANHAIDRFNTSLAYLALQTDLFEESLASSTEEGNGFLDFLNNTLHLDKTIKNFQDFGDSIGYAFDEMERQVDLNRNNQFTEASRDTVMAANAMRLFGNNVKEAVPELTYFEAELRSLGVYSKDTENKLNGLALVFTEIEEAALKSNASSALDEIGFSAAQIEEILTRPDWATIFGQISHLARLAAIDIAMSTTLAMAIGIDNAQAALDKLLASFNTGSGGGGGTAAKDYVKDFFSGITAEIEKQEARIKLERMGASEGLIEAIIGSQGFEKVFARILRDGVSGLNKLQGEFNRTGAGIDELTSALEEFEKAQKKALEAAQDEIDSNAEALQRLADTAQQAYERAVEAADEFLYKMMELGQIDILPNAEEEIGKFESQIVDSIDRIRTELKSAFRDKLIYQEDFDAISAWASAEEFELRRIAQARDDLANRFSLSEALIGDYQKALTGALQLTSLLGQIKKETEKRTVTEVQEGMVSIAGSMRVFGLTISRSYEETIDKTVSKSEGLLQGFRDMAVKAREFAENLRKLDQMGLDPMLFDQLVQAGVVAGGETAQALIDGGQDSVDEISDIFAEINTLGADLGEEVAASLYGSGIDMADGLLEGIRSKQDEFSAQARAMAKAFSDEFNAKLTVAAAKPVEAAREVAQTAQTVATQAATANAAALKQLDDLISGASRALEGKLPSSFIPGIQEKLGAFQALRTDILSGQVQDISSITAGMTSADAAAALRATGGATVNNYYEVKVEASSRSAGAKAGEAAVEALQRFGNVNGNFQVSVNV
jgi:hypothetical protein